MTTTRPFLRASCALVLLLTGCVRDPGLGPDLGDCAEPPEGVYTYGQLGIGTCLAGPTDIRFFDQGGRTWMGITNANPFRLFTSGSFLAVALDSIDFSEPVIDIADLEAYALPMEEFVGRLAVSESRGLAVIPSRLSEDAFTGNAPDQTWLVDISDPTTPVFSTERPFLSASADPYDVAFDPTSEYAFVLNHTGNSVSVIDIGASPPDFVDPAPASIITEGTFTDVDDSGSSAEMIGDVAITSSGDDILVTDTWTATWVDGTARVWAETATGGLERFTSGSRDYVPTAFQDELSPALAPGLTAIRDPWMTFGASALVSFFGDRELGTIVSAVTDGTAGVWGDAITVLTGANIWDAFVSGPSLISLDGRSIMFYDGREAAGEDASIGLANTADGTVFRGLDNPILSPSGTFSSLEQPSALVDDLTGSVRLWMSAWNGTSWVIAHAESRDGAVTWSEPTEVLSLPGGHAAAPVVQRAAGRYEMWLATSDGTRWEHSVAWSWDGVNWSEPETILPAQRDFDLALPPRLGVMFDSTAGWRLEGNNVGVLNDLATAGQQLTFSTQGFSVRIASGHEVGTTVAGPLSEGGVVPGSVVDTSGIQTMYATVRDGDDVTRLVALRQIGETWNTAATDLIPKGSGGNIDGANSPVVFPVGDRWHMLYGAVEGEVTTMRVAESTDGLNFTPLPDDALPDRPEFALQAADPHSVQILDDGTFRVWYAGFDGRTFRIGAADSTNGVTFTPVSNGITAHQLGFGEPGTFDDGGVSEPMVVRDGDTTRMWYSGFDGNVWSIGLATLNPDGVWERYIPPGDEVPSPVLTGTEDTFATVSVRTPVALSDGAGGWHLWHAGSDGFESRVGLAHTTTDVVFPTYRFPTTDDQISFVTRRGEEGRSEIEMAQVVDGVSLGFRLTGDGPTASALDPERGLLFVVAPSTEDIVAIDVRDDSSGDFDDLNYLDVEDALRVYTSTSLAGFHDIQLGPNGLLYLAAKEPDGIVVVDSSIIVDDDKKDLHYVQAEAVLPMHDVTDDAGEVSASFVGASGLAWVPGQDLLVATHFRDNSVSIFDLGLGPRGEEIRYIPQLGENPHLVRITPDGRHAIVAVYQGYVADGVTSPYLAVIDLDPTNATYLSVVSRIVNR